MGFVELLNALLAILFPLWPWELFIVMPFALAYLYPRALKDSSVKPTCDHLLLFITGFGAVFCGIGHTAGLIQAIQTVFGGTGICVSALPGAPDDVETGGMCVMMSVHIFLMVIMGYFFLYLMIDPAKRGTGFVPSVKESVFYTRCALFFIVGGISQIVPYLAVIAAYPSRFLEFMAMPGFYSQRPFTPGFTEFGEPLIWIGMGFYFIKKAQKGSVALL